MLNNNKKNLNSRYFLSIFVPLVELFNYFLALRVSEGIL
ncbi:hypothetical protein VIBC2010_11889 [Vibrio caribbeanicus ATCC BAA-2122]|uniref:Uncharacterized protein n=1 Tax=Vibrio caribbeanicus ATCC BAA-2122 TaxID=796620 RepID=E3BKS1_9VIBR|nr:hypothetical protein VIBC2010_11889 [Vibrio caribbeanicus ATCC BAA-2122]